MHRNLAHWVRCVLISLLWKNSQNSRLLNRVFKHWGWFCCHLVVKKKKERKYWVHPILKYREDGEFRLLIKDQRDYHGRFKVYFRMSVAQFDVSDTRATLKRRPPISVSSVCLVLRDEVDELDNSAILDFGVRLYGGSELSKHLSKCLLRMRKTQKKNIYIYFLNRTRSEFFLTDENFGGSV